MTTIRDEFSSPSAVALLTVVSRRRRRRMGGPEAPGQARRAVLAFVGVAVVGLAACGPSEEPAPVGQGAPEPVETLPAVTTAPVESTDTVDLRATVPGEVIPTTVSLTADERIKQWDIGSARISFDVPVGFALDPRAGRAPIDPGDVPEIDLLYSWVNTECECSVQLLVQPRPPDGLPVYELKPYETVEVRGLSWGLIDLGDGDRRNVIALAFTADRMLTLTAPADRLVELANRAEIRRRWR